MTQTISPLLPMMMVAIGNARVVARREVKMVSVRKCIVIDWL